jgi:hypothetical protein
VSRACASISADRPDPSRRWASVDLVDVEGFAKMLRTPDPGTQGRPAGNQQSDLHDNQAQFLITEGQDSSRRVNALSRLRTPQRFMLAGGILGGIGVLAAGVFVFGSAKASLIAGGQNIATIDMPLGGGSIQSVDVVTGPNARPVPVAVRGREIVATKPVAAGTALNVQVVVNRPGWDAWFAGSRQRLSINVTTPVASLRSHYLTVDPSAPLRLHFKAPIEAYSLGGSPRHLTRHVLASLRTVVTVPHAGDAGTEFISAQPRSWEKSAPSSISWFSPGSSATAVASPSPGSTINTPIGSLVDVS